MSTTSGIDCPRAGRTAPWFWSDSPCSRKGRVPKHLEYIYDIVVWGNAVEERRESNSASSEGQFGHQNRQGQGTCISNPVLGNYMARWALPDPNLLWLNKTTAMSPTTNKKFSWVSWVSRKCIFQMTVRLWALSVKWLGRRMIFKWDPEWQQTLEKIRKETVHAVGSQDRWICNTCALHHSRGRWSYLEPLAKGTRGILKSTLQVVLSSKQRIVGQPHTSWKRDSCLPMGLAIL